MLFTLLLSLFIDSANALECSQFNGCKLRLCELEQEIIQAEKMGHKERASDLRGTLSRNRAACESPASLDTKASDAAAQVNYREMEVQDQKNFDNMTKAAIKQMILDDEKMDLEEAQKKK